MLSERILLVFNVDNVLVKKRERRYEADSVLDAKARNAPLSILRRV